LSFFARLFYLGFGFEAGLGRRRLGGGRGGSCGLGVGVPFRRLGLLRSIFRLPLLLATWLGRSGSAFPAAAATSALAAAASWSSWSTTAAAAFTLAAAAATSAAAAAATAAAWIRFFSTCSSVRPMQSVIYF
jgi:hypothetical protein